MFKGQRANMLRQPSPFALLPFLAGSNLAIVPAYPPVEASSFRPLSRQRKSEDDSFCHRSRPRHVALSKSFRYRWLLLPPGPPRRSDTSIFEVVKV